MNIEITTRAPKGYTIVRTSHDPAYPYPPCPGVTEWFKAGGRGIYGGCGGWTEGDVFLGDAFRELLDRNSRGMGISREIGVGRTVLLMFKAKVSA